MSRPKITALSACYGVHPKQVRRWRDRGIDIFRPDHVLEAVASQNRPGKTLDRLLAPGELERTSQLIHNLFTASKS
jgi:hypothetical protein